MKINSSSRITYDEIIENFGPQKPSQCTYDELISCFHIVTNPTFVIYNPMSDMISVVRNDEAPKVDVDLSLIEVNADTEPRDLLNFNMLPWLPAPHLTPGPMTFLCSGWLFAWTANPHTGRWGLKAVAKH